MRRSASLPHLPHSLTAPGYGLLRAAQAGLAVAILASLLWAGWLYRESASLQAAAARMEQADARLRDAARHEQAQAKQAGFDVSEGRLKTLAPEVAFANRLLEKRAFSWTRLLNDLEAAVPPHISLHAVAVSFKDSTVALNGAARTLLDVATLVNALERHQAFHTVTLGQHQVRGKTPEMAAASTEPDPTRHVSFSLSATYQPDEGGAPRP